MIKGVVGDLQIISVVIRGTIWRRPRISCQQPGNHRVYSLVVGNGSIDLRRGWHTPERRNSYCFSLSLIRNKPEGPILLDWPTKRETKLVVVKNVLCLVFGVEEIASIKLVVAKIFIRRAVNAVGARLGNDVHSGA